MTVEVKLVGNRCNLRCAYCYEQGAREAAAPLDKAAVFREIDRLGGVFHLFGGEALLSPLADLEEFFAYGQRKFKRSLKLVPSPERERYAAQVTAQVAAKAAPQEQAGVRTSSGTARRTRTARVEAAAGRFPDLAGTAWQGVILIPTPKGTMQWPLQFTVDEANRIALAYKVQHAATGEMMGFLVRGTYNPADQRFALQFTRTLGRNTLTGTLNGRAQTATAAGGQAALSGTPGQGVWRVSPAN